MPRAIPTQHITTVQLSTISTPREQLLSVKPGPVQLDTIERAEEMHIYQLPVLTEQGDLAGLIPLTKLKKLYGTQEQIDTAKAEIRIPELPGEVELLDLLNALAEKGAVIHRAAADEQRDASWFALLTNADLNRPVFRANVYLVLATMETSLGEVIMDEFRDDWGAIRLLNDHTQGRVKEYYDEAKAEGVELSPIVHITLSDMFFIAAKSREVWKNLGFESPDKLEEVGHTINEIRNRVMHPIQPLINRGSDVVELRDVVQQIIELTQTMQHLAESGNR